MSSSLPRSSLSSSRSASVTGGNWPNWFPSEGEFARMAALRSEVRASVPRQSKRANGDDCRDKGDTSPQGNAAVSGLWPAGHTFPRVGHALFCCPWSYARLFHPLCWPPDFGIEPEDATQMLTVGINQNGLRIFSVARPSILEPEYTSPWRLPSLFCAILAKTLLSAFRLNCPPHRKI